MFKHLSISAAFCALATSSVNAQQQEAVLRKMDVAGAPLEIIVATPKVGGDIYHLANSPDALIVHLIGGELALAFDAEEKMLKALDSLRMPVCAFHVDSKVSRTPVSVYIVPKAE
jgi:hypothetical protein